MTLASVGYETTQARTSLGQLTRDSATGLEVEGSLPRWAWMVTGDADDLAREEADRHTVTVATEAASDRLDDLSWRRESAAEAESRATTDLVEARGELERAQQALTRTREMLRGATRAMTDLEVLATRARTQLVSIEEADALDAEQAGALLEEAHDLVAQISERLAALSPQLRKLFATSAGTISYPGTGELTSPFGMRFHPILRYTKLHTGMDLAVGDGVVYAAADGVVVDSSWNTAYGNLTVIAHGNGEEGTLTTWYAHQSVSFVSPGDEVRAGDMIGSVGSTGYSTGPHIHFEVRVAGAPVDPLTFLDSAGRPDIRDGSVNSGDQKK